MVEVCVQFSLEVGPNIHSSTSVAGCDKEDGSTEGAVRLRGGFGTLCDPIHSGYIEVLHEGEWGSICTTEEAENTSEDNLVADVACRQLGFPHGSRVDPLTAGARPPEDDEMTSYTPYYFRDTFYSDVTEENEEPVERYWLSSVACAGPESRLTDCDLGPGFRQNNEGCNRASHRIHFACRQFAVVEALEEITSAGAGDVFSLRIYLTYHSGYGWRWHLPLASTIDPTI